jgi:uncharacterized membrane protein YdbT with pleckstrin-like domain
VPFPRKLLNEGEQVVLDLRPHWWYFSKPLVFLLVAAVASIVVGVLGINDYLLYVLLALTAFGLLWFITRYIKWTTTSFVVTTDRLVTRTGVFSKHAREIPLERVNDITCDQSFFERILHSGNVVIESAGERGQEVVRQLPKPFAVQNEVYRQIELAQARNADRMSGRRELSVPEQIEKLDELRQRGVISQAEFDAKKSQLLDKM